MTPQEKVASALYKMVGLNALNEKSNMIPLMNLYSGVMIGLRIGVTDIHAARMVEECVLTDGTLDPITQSVVDEILKAVES